MVAIKDFDMPKGCWYSTNLKMSGVTTCSLKSYCSEKHIKEAPLDTRPSDCPLVEIEEHKGKWIEHNQTTVDGSRDYIECSYCKVWFGEWEMPRNSYCPNCGAKMVGDETKYDCVKCKHDGFICDECENGSKYEEMRGSENEVN